MFVMNCRFCGITKDQYGVLKIGKNVAVILSNPRLMPGHMLVVPLRHVEKISELNDEERKELFDTVVEFEEKILKKLAKGCDIRQNYRPFQKEDRLRVNHLHVHLQPREFEDALYQKSQIFEKEAFADLEKEEAEKIAGLFSE